MKILIACEFSGTVREAFNRLGGGSMMFGLVIYCLQKFKENIMKVTLWILSMMAGI